ncbi:MAG: prepilin-type N-terminal cleavage/methylation domain-containing protein [Phycisphaera sp. RhM]|nr:prepilin-type N-terminal cleavage/methylation domain-containing protein [Phycisphaera sp. RhM]
MSRPSSPFAASSRRHCRRHCRRHRRGAARHAFTLLELLLVLAILVVLGGIVAVNVVGTGQAANADATTAQLKMLKSNIDMFQIRMNSLPQTLEELRDGPSDAAKKAKWVAPIITEIPKDAWGNDIDYSVNGNSYELRSGGIDGQKNTEDDIVVTP